LLALWAERSWKMPIKLAVVQLVLLLFLFHGSALLYLDSLEGGSIGWIHLNMFRLTILLISSALGMATAFIVTILSPFSKTVKVIFLFYGTCIMSILILSDQVIIILKIIFLVLIIPTGRYRGEARRV